MSSDITPSDNFIQWFRSTSPYLYAHRGRTLVLVLSGEAVMSQQFSHLMQDIALLHGLGLRILLVHGVRPQIEACLEQYQGQSHYVEQLRVTDEVALDCVKRAIGEVRVNIEAKLSMSHLNIRVHSGNFITAQPIGVQQGVDYLFTGKVRKINQQAIIQQLDAGDMVLVSPLGYSPSGEAFNLSSNELGACIAKSIGADKLLYLHNEGECHVHVPSDLRPQEVTNSIIDRLPFGFGQLLTYAATACRHGIKRVHLLDQSIDGVLLKELFTRDGQGVMVSGEAYEEMRIANIDDVADILALLAPLEDTGVLVRRSREKIEIEIDHFSVMERDGLVIACAALYCYDETNSAEIACVAVDNQYRNQGRGEALLSYLEQNAATKALDYLFVLTTQTAHWFQEKGFEPANIDKLPKHKQQLYNYHRNSKVFVKLLT